DFNGLFLLIIQCVWRFSVLSAGTMPHPAGICCLGYPVLRSLPQASDSGHGGFVIFQCVG
ncbi:hypothetical protein M0L75_004480, partial [Escherichia coli]